MDNNGLYRNGSARSISNMKRFCNRVNVSFECINDSQRIQHRTPKIMYVMWHAVVATEKFATT